MTFPGGVTVQTNRSLFYHYIICHLMVLLLPFCTVPRVVTALIDCPIQVLSWGGDEEGWCALPN